LRIAVWSLVFMLGILYVERLETALNSLCVLPVVYWLLSFFSTADMCYNRVSNTHLSIISPVGG